MYTYTVHFRKRVNDMKASILDLRRNMKAILKSLDQNESVTLTYHGKEKATIIPKKKPQKVDFDRHPAFGIWSNRKDLEDTQAALRRMRKGRSNAV